MPYNTQQSKTEPSHETCPELAHDWGGRCSRLRVFSPAFWFTAQRHLLGQMGQTVRKPANSNPETSPAESFRPLRLWRSSHFLSLGMHCWLTAACKMLGNHGLHEVPPTSAFPLKPLRRTMADLAGTSGNSAREACSLPSFRGSRYAPLLGRREFWLAPIETHAGQR